MNTSAIYSKTGKGVQEASGKTSQLSRGDRAILSAIDGKINLKDLSAKFDRAPDDKFLGLIRKLDADGFIREVNPGVAQRGAANAPRPAAAKPAAPSGAGEELDFTQIFSAPPKQAKPAAPAAPAGDPMAAARHEAEMRQRAEREAKAKAEAAAKATTDAGMKARQDAEARAKSAREAAMQAAAEGKTQAEIEARSRTEAEAKSRAEAEARAQAAQEARARVEAETARKAQEARDTQARAQFEAEELRRKVEEERRAREAAEHRAREEAERSKREAEERARRETEEKARRETEELRKKLDEERKAREAAEHRAREERDKRERERAQEDTERRAREDVERKAREERDRREQEENQRQIRMAREAEDKKRRDADARKRKEQETRRWQEEETRRKSDDGYRQRAEQEDKERAGREAAEAVERAQVEKKAAEVADALSGSLMADLDSFSKREEEERKEKQEQDRIHRAEMQRKAQDEEARREQEEAERRARKEEDKRRKEEEARRVQEEERQAREAEAKAQEEEAERKKLEAEARKAATEDIPISRADLGRDDVADDERKLTPEARKALRDREREVARARDRGDQPSAKAASAYRRKQPVKWGKPVALALFFLLVGGVGVVNFLPLSTAEYEKLASDAVGVPVKIGSARMWVLAGVQMRFERVSIGESIRIAEVRAVPELGSLLDDSKAFSRVEVDKVTLPQEALGGVLLGAMQGSRLRVGRVVAKEVKLEGPLALPVVDADAAIGSDGRVYSVRLSGERVSGQLTAKGDSVAFEVTLGSFTLPFLEKLSIADFGMKGSANRQGMTLSEFDGRLYDGTVVGKGRMQWGAQWNVQGEIQGRTMNAAVFAPQLVSEGRFEGKGRFAMAGSDPAKLGEGARLDGSFTVTKGALGSFDLSRALQSTSAQASGRTPFSEFAGSVALSNGALAMRDLKLSSGLLTANGSLDVDASGALSGRVNAELRNLRGTFYIGGKLGEPQLRR